MRNMGFKPRVFHRCRAFLRQGGDFDLLRIYPTRARSNRFLAPQARNLKARHGSAGKEGPAKQESRRDGTTSPKLVIPSSHELAVGTTSCSNLRNSLRVSRYFRLCAPQFRTI